MSSISHHIYLVSINSNVIGCKYNTIFNFDFSLNMRFFEQCFELAYNKYM